LEIGKNDFIYSGIYKMNTFKLKRDQEDEYVLCMYDISIDQTIYFINGRFFKSESGDREKCNLTRGELSPYIFSNIDFLPCYGYGYERYDLNILEIENVELNRDNIYILDNGKKNRKYHVIPTLSLDRVKHLSFYDLEVRLDRILSLEF
jgi:hypothetical protein